MKVFNKFNTRRNRRATKDNDTGNDKNSYFDEDLPRTPNGASDLLDENDNQPYHIDEDAPHLFSCDPAGRLMFVEEDSDEDQDTATIYTTQDDDGSENSKSGDIYMRLNSFEEKMESELQDLEAFGVKVPMAAPSPPPAMFKKTLDPNGKGERTSSFPSDASVATASTTSSRSTASSKNSSSSKNSLSSKNCESAPEEKEESALTPKGNGQSGKQLVCLSHKTDQIMSDYQAYLAEIQYGEEQSPMESLYFDQGFGDEEMATASGITDPALVNIHQVRENLRDSYLMEQQQHAARAVDVYEEEEQVESEVPPREDNYATGGGQPLERAWSYNSKSYSGDNMNDNVARGIVNVGYYYDRASELGQRVLVTGGDCMDRCADRNGRNPHYFLRSRRAKRGAVVIALLVCMVIGISVGVSHGKKNEEDLSDWQAEFEEEEEEKVLELKQEENKVLAKSEEETKPQNKMELMEMAMQEMKQQLEMDETMLIQKQVEETEEAKVETDEKETLKMDLMEKVMLGMQEQIEKDEWLLAKQHADEMKEAKVETHEKNASTAAVAPDNNEKESPDEDEWLLAKQHADEIEEAKVETDEKNASTAAVAPDNNEKEASDYTDEELGAGQELDMDDYYNVMTKYNPIMYDRSKGYTGQTFMEALIFCDAQGGLAVCPYEAICPRGTEGEPLGGYRDSPTGDWAWMPMLDKYNEWVQGGAREKCVKYSNENGGLLPEWGTTGEGNEGMTQNVMCCHNVM